MIGSGEHPMFAFGLPRDAVSWTAIVCALCCLLPWSKLPRLPSARWMVFALALLSAALSLGYFYHYLDGQPRVIDATTYLFEARSLALGSFGFRVPVPSASFRGRFILSTVSDPQVVAGIFPPGYPLVLSIGERFGHFELVGPCLAALLVVATYRLSRVLFQQRSVALVAAALSTSCAALRYHTADTMAHGLAALLGTLALVQVAELARPQPELRSRVDFRVMQLGLIGGMLLCTRQLTAIALCGAMTLGLASFRRYRSSYGVRLLAIALLFSLPGWALLLGQHHFITDDIFLSPQLAYYERADGPPGCFALGFGSGCHYEHADAVAMQGGHGLTPAWSLLNTVHRLHWFLMDVANFEPLSLVALLAAWQNRKNAGLRAPLLALLALPVAYSAFYFNGSYPGAGARFLSELLPIGHVLLACGLVRLRAVRWGLFCVFFGFGVHASFSHDQLRGDHFGPNTERLSDLGELIRAKKPAHTALVFFSTAHHFNLAAQSDSSFVAARATFDARQDLLIHDVAPDASYLFDEKNGLLALPAPDAQRFEHQVWESEFDYPALSLENVWVHPEYVPLPCVSRGRALRVHRTGSDPRLTLELTPPPAPPGEIYRLTLRLVDTREGAVPCREAILGWEPRAGTFQLDVDQWLPFTHIDAIELTSVPR